MNSDDLDRLYAQVPEVGCKGLCVSCCSSVGATEEETIRIESRHGIRVETGFYEDGCPALSPFGRCSVYANRPLVCRLWGAVEAMACPHGCVPESGWMDENVAMALMRELTDFPSSDRWRSELRMFWNPS